MSQQRSAPDEPVGTARDGGVDPAPGARLPEGDANPAPRVRRPATVAEAKALAHPLRIRILRLCGHEELTNKELADRLGRDPATIHYHVKQLVDAGFLEPATVRTGTRGALEKPYRSTRLTWWLENPLGHLDVESRYAPIEAFEEELREGGPASVQTYSRFALHLSPEDVEELDRRILTVLDEFVETDDQRRDQPLHGGIVLIHRQEPPPAGQ